MMIVRAEFSSELFRNIMQRKADYNRNMSLLFFSLSVILIILSKKEGLLDGIFGEKGKAIAFFVVVAVLLVFCYKALMIRFKLNSARDSFVSFDGEKIVYDMLWAKEIIHAYKNERMIYEISHCSKIEENAYEYVFYGDINAEKLLTYGGKTDLKLDKVAIPKYFAGMSRIVSEFKKIKKIY